MNGGWWLIEWRGDKSRVDESSPAIHLCFHRHGLESERAGAFEKCYVSNVIANAYANGGSGRSIEGDLSINGG